MPAGIEGSVLGTSTTKEYSLPHTCISKIALYKIQGRWLINRRHCYHQSFVSGVVYAYVLMYVCFHPTLISVLV